MNRFAALVDALEAQSDNADQQAALLRYLQEAPEADAAWAMHLLAGHRPRRVIDSERLQHAAQVASGLSPWLFQTALDAVGDVAEGCALVLALAPPTALSRDGLAQWMTQTLPAMQPLDGEPLDAHLSAAWETLTPQARWVFNRLLIGGFRTGVRDRVWHQAVAAFAGLTPALVAARRVEAGAQPLHEVAVWRGLVAPLDSPGPALRRVNLPQVFAPEQVLAGDPVQTLGEASDWVVTWRPDGLPVQIVKGRNAVSVWSADGEWLSGHLPELVALAQHWPADTVVEGHAVALRPGEPEPDGVARAGPFLPLQQRLARPPGGRRGVATVVAGFLATDLLQLAGQTPLNQTLSERLDALASFAQGEPSLVCLLPLPAHDWPAVATWRDRARAESALGLLLRRSADSRGDLPWPVWFWPAEARRLKAVLMYAPTAPGQADFGFGVWNRPPRDAAELAAVQQAIAAGHPPVAGDLQLLTLTRTGEGLQPAERQALAAAARSTVAARFGPVHSLVPSLVVEIGFDAVTSSARHKCGYVLSGPRMLRLCRDTPLLQAACLADLAALAP
ncbi:MAG: ATP-dependent DNA ligase [Hydrogenophaga sp.]|uniref:ATP-dependent DNA ligase n=1 Tax=Hydrogenophaga sp. TaxID=1904254 RepID=UPI001D42B929|nr:ATP-dependent DNA ligase [Hydrogenophaga sp.]MBX3609285.1 ATP-dependent DNA ligase [Hydrogenophaga sp.]